MENVTVIQSKLIPPVPQETYMRRSPFIKKMNEALKRQVILVHSGPGYGKSLGLSQYFRDHNHLYSWYTVTEEDDDIIPFFAYLTASIKRIKPDFGKSIDDVMIPSGFVSDEEIQQWLALFINELCEITEPLVIIIDDFHLVDYVFQINIFMERLIKLLPPHVRIVISGRTRPKWTNLLKLKMNNRLYELTKEDFVFSKEEIIVYLEDYFQIRLNGDEANEIHAVTEGWAIAVNLLALQWSETETIKQIIDPAFQNVFDYLSEEVFKRRSEEEQEWLLKFAIFPNFSYELIERFYGKEGVCQLDNIAAEHAFLQSLGDNTFRYHALFAQFLKNKWQEVDPRKYAELNKRATKHYLEENNHFQATYHATLTDDQPFLADILTKTASSLIRSGQFDWFLEVYQRLDESVRDAYYSLYYYEGEVHRYRAFYEQARRAYQRCLEHAEEHHDAYFISRSNAGMAHIYLDTIQPALAESYLIKAIHYSQVTDKMSEKERDLLKRQFAENLVNLGRAKDAKIWVQTEKLDASILREGNLDARIHLRMGKLEEAENILLEHMGEKAKLPDSHREANVLLSLIYTMIGDLDRAIKEAELGIKSGEERKSRFVEAVGHTRKGHAELIAYPNDIERAERSYEKAIELMEQLKVSRTKAEPFMGLVGVKVRKRLYDEAIQDGNYALKETAKVNDDWLSALIMISLGIVHYYQKNFDESKRHLLKAERAFIQSGDLYHQMVTYFWLMNVYFQEDDRKNLRETAKSFLKIMFAENYQFFLLKDTLFGPIDRHLMYPLFQRVNELLPEEERMKSAAGLIRLKEYEGHPGYQIYVKIFGSLKMAMSNKYGPELEWQREKAKEMFLYFLMNRDRYIPKEEMMQQLWGELDEKSADRNFKVTLNALLKALEPERQAREPSFFILRNKNMYRLNPKATIITDRNLFLEHAEKGMKHDDPKEALDQLLAALAFYEDAPFEDMRNVEWLEQEKSKLENKRISVLERTAQICMKLKRYNDAIAYAENILKIDPTWEEAYRILMMAYYRLDNRPQSIKWYEQCVKVLHEELNIEPMPLTTDLYHLIVHHDDWDSAQN